MGAVRMRVQTADNNITIIPTASVYQLTSYEVKKLHVCNNNRNKIMTMFLTSNHSHSDGTQSLENPLVSKCCDEKTNLHLTFFGVNYSFNLDLTSHWDLGNEAPFCCSCLSICKTSVMYKHLLNRHICESEDANILHSTHGQYS